MVSHLLKCVFVEVPKTGSSSIRTVLREHGGKGTGKPHQDLVEISKKIDPATMKQYYKFGFVRNPWDRVVSLYERKEGMKMSSKMSFKEFVSWIQLSSSTSIHPSPKKNQLNWFTDRQGRNIADFIGRFEDLEKDWGKIGDRLGLSVPLPHKNQNPKEHYTKYYDSRTQKIIAKKFKVDIDYFGYRFGQ